MKLYEDLQECDIDSRGVAPKLSSMGAVREGSCHDNDNDNDNEFSYIYIGI